MIRITDRTLSCLDGLPPDRPAYSRFLSLLIEMDPGAIELSERAYSLLSPLPEYPSYVLRVGRAADAAKYPRVAEFVSSDAPVGADERIRAEIRLNGISGNDITASYAGRAKARVLGMDGALRGDYPRTFARLKEFFGSDIEFCPTDRYHCATALAVEWAACGAGGGIVTAFGGIGGFAPTEEVAMAMRMNGLRGADRIYGFFPEMASLFGKIAKKNTRPNKPVIGKRIFHVESGIHVDGILKQPKCYEPFPPEAVGQERKIILGKQSGAASIRAKLSEFNIEIPDEDIPRILDAVRAKAMENGGAVTDVEFAEIAKKTPDSVKPVTYIVHGDTRQAAQRQTDRAKPRRYIVDSTLRDGEQTPGICFSAEQKLDIAALLDAGGVHQIEAGVPAASGQEKENIARIIENRRSAVISVWARLVPSDIEHAIDVQPDIIHVCVPVSRTHIREKLRKDENWVTGQLRACLALIDKGGIPLSVGFEDAFRADVDFMVSVAGILLDSGVTRVRLSDTVGVATPGQCRAVLNGISARLDGRADFGIHAHNDLGMAVANTVEAAKSGCLYADVTAGGIGERAGNCDLAQLVCASSPIFDWGMTAIEARRLEREVNKVIRCSKVK